MSGPRTDLLVDGAWTPASDGGRLDVVDPATGEIICAVADATTDDATAAIQAAVAAQSDWAATAPRARAEILRAAHDEVIRQADDLARIMTQEMGKPLAESLAEVRYSADFLRWFAEEAVRVHGDYRLAPAGGRRVVTLRQPVGPCLMITPWNFPMAMGARKLGPALAAGCTAVVKPASATPLSMLALGEILVSVGVPPGVVNVLPTSRPAAVTETVLDAPGLRKVSFTGSTEVGRALAAESARRMLRVSMELGGNAPFLVFEDADLPAAVADAVTAKLRNGGEACTAANRFLVQDPVAEEFGEMLAAEFSRLRVGHGMAEGSQVGPLIGEAARTQVLALVEDAVRRGARPLTGGRAIEGPGCFVEPTVLVAVPDSAQVLQQEIFGPVAPITRFAEEAEAIRLANDTPYGLVAYVHTQNLSRGLRVSEALETGMVGLNTGIVSDAGAPFGGIKASGLGREGGREGIEEYLEVKYVGIGGV